MSKGNPATGVRGSGNAGTPVKFSSQIGPWAMVPVWVLMLPELTAGEIRIYAAIRSFCDMVGDCFPTMKMIAERSASKLGSVRNAVQKFRRLGLLTTAEVWRPGTNELSHFVYHLVDVKPAVLGAEVSEGVHPTVDTPTPDSAGVYTERLTQEQTSEQSINQTTLAIAPERDAKASTLPRQRRVSRNKQRTEAEDDAEAFQLIVAEGFLDEPEAAILVEYLRKGLNAATTAGFVQHLIDSGGYALESKYQEAAEWHQKLEQQYQEDYDFFVEEWAFVHFDACELAQAFREAVAIGCAVEALNTVVNNVHDASNEPVAQPYLDAIKEPVRRRMEERIVERRKRATDSRRRAA